MVRWQPLGKIPSPELNGDKFYMLKYCAFGTYKTTTMAVSKQFYFSPFLLNFISDIYTLVLLKRNFKKKFSQNYTLIKNIDFIAKRSL